MFQLELSWDAIKINNLCESLSYLIAETHPRCEKSLEDSLIAGLKMNVSPAQAIELADQRRPRRAYAAMHFAQ